MKRFLWFAAFSLLVALGVIGLSLSPDLLTRWVRRDVAVAIGGTPITKADLTMALRADLWRQGKSWDEMDAAAQSRARELSLAKLIDEHLVRHYREHSAPPAANETAVHAELTMWRKQFQEAAEVQGRLAYQEMSESELETDMRARQLDQAWIEAQIQGPATLVTTAEIKAWYDAHRETLRVPEAHRAAHIYLTRHDKTKPDREPEIREIAQKLTSSQATFAELAAQFSEDDRSKLRGGDLDWFTATRMPADFMAAVTRLKVGQTSAPVLTALGWHIIQVTDRKPPVVPPLEAVSAEIEALLRTQKRSAAVAVVLENLRQRAVFEGLVHRRADVIASSRPAEKEG